MAAIGVAVFPLTCESESASCRRRRTFAERKATMRIRIPIRITLKLAQKTLQNEIAAV